MQHEQQFSGSGVLENDREADGKLGSLMWQGMKIEFILKTKNCRVLVRYVDDSP